MKYDPNKYPRKKRHINTVLFCCICLETMKMFLEKNKTQMTSIHTLRKDKCNTLIFHMIMLTVGRNTECLFFNVTYKIWKSVRNAKDLFKNANKVKRK